MGIIIIISGRNAEANATLAHHNRFVQIQYFPKRIQSIRILTPIVCKASGDLGLTGNQQITQWLSVLKFEYTARRCLGEVGWHFESNVVERKRKKEATFLQFKRKSKRKDRETRPMTQSQLKGFLHLAFSCKSVTKYIVLDDPALRYLTLQAFKKNTSILTPTVYNNFSTWKDYSVTVLLIS